ncbi:MAG: hypothetical protein J4F50_10145 [Acidimicrobiia bacterium]|nr:hypothetical protein [Acidimicrobiia bacterium]
MSTLWTPGGEVPVGDRRTGASDESAAPDDAAASLEDFDLDSLSPEEREQADQYIRELAESRERLKAVPAAVVVANHAMGLYELAALHLSSQPPNFGQAAVAIDALGALLEGMQGRLGEAESTLRDGLSQIRMAFVQLKNRPQDGDAEEFGNGNSEDEPAA